MKFLDAFLKLSADFREKWCRQNDEWFARDDVDGLCSSQFADGGRNFARLPSGSSNDLFRARPENVPFDDSAKNFSTVTALHGLEEGHAADVFPCNACGERVEHHPTADRDYRRELPNDETVSVSRHDPFTKTPMRKHSL